MTIIYRLKMVNLSVSHLLRNIDLMEFMETNTIPVKNFVRICELVDRFRIKKCIREKIGVYNTLGRCREITCMDFCLFGLQMHTAPPEEERIKTGCILNLLEHRSDIMILNIRNTNRIDITQLVNMTRLKNLNVYNALSLEPLSNMKQLRHLEIGGDNITSLEPLKNLIGLKYLLIHNNTKITTLKPISNLVNLSSLHIHCDKIKSLKPLEKMHKLTHLIISHNEIRRLDPIRHLHKLEYLNIYGGKISSLEPLKNLTNLTYVCCRENNIRTLKHIKNLTNLVDLDVYQNNIGSIEPIRNLTQLQRLFIQYNNIKCLNPIINLINLRDIYYGNNPLDIQTIQIERLLERIDNRRMGKNNNSIYGNGQNVHDSHIQKTVTNSVQNLLKDPKPTFDLNDILDSSLKKSTKDSILKYCSDKTIHSVQLITYLELISYVWQRIIKSKHKDELIKILDEQITDSHGLCFTGRFNRTISVLQGFYEDINISISSSSQISAIILNLKNKYNGEELITKIRHDLTDMGYEESEFIDWINALDDFE